MFEKRATALGRGLVKSLSSIVIEKQGVPAEQIWNTIEDFGIEQGALQKLKPTQKELFEVYSAIKAYRLSVKYLQTLKTRID